MVGVGHEAVTGEVKICLDSRRSSRTMMATATTMVTTSAILIAVDGASVRPGAATMMLSTLTTSDGQ